MAGNKYGARTVQCAGHTHPSVHERERCWIAQERAARGEIRYLRRQTVWPLIVNGQRVGRYTSDLDFEERQPDGSWVFVVEEAKGYAARDWILRKRVFEACYGWKVRVT